jgi:RNA polymerase sigma-70 factor (ECF subfamily)
MSSASVAPVRVDGAIDFDELFESELDYVWKVLRRLGVREADLDDQVNEVFLRIHRKLDGYDSSRPLRPWIFAFAARVAAEHRRLLRNQREIPGLPIETADPAPNAEERMEENQTRRLVLLALEGLDPDKREVFVAMELEGHSGPDIAAALGISVNTVYSRLRLAKGEFTTLLRRLRRSP